MDRKRRKAFDVLKDKNTKVERLGYFDSNAIKISIGAKSNLVGLAAVLWQMQCVGKK